MDGENRDRSRENGHSSVAVFIAENHVKVAAFCFPSGKRCGIPWLV